MDKIKKHKIPIIMITLVVIIGALFLLPMLVNEEIEILDLCEKDMPTIILSQSDTVIVYEKTIVTNPFEITVVFTCDRFLGYFDFISPVSRVIIIQGEGTQP